MTLEKSMPSSSEGFLMKLYLVILISPRRARIMVDRLFHSGKKYGMKNQHRQITSNENIQEK